MLFFFNSRNALYSQWPISIVWIYIPLTYRKSLIQVHQQIKTPILALWTWKKSHPHYIILFFFAYIAFYLAPILPEFAICYKRNGIYFVSVRVKMKENEEWSNFGTISMVACPSNGISTSKSQKHSPSRKSHIEAELHNITTIHPRPKIHITFLGWLPLHF